MGRKNLILMMADELRADFVGAYGSKDAKTPCLDSLAEEGVIFTNHFTNHTKCVPSRACLFSGRHSHLGGHRTLGIELRPGEENLAGLLKENGYRTSMVERNHTIDESWLDKNFDEWLKLPEEGMYSFAPAKDVSVAERRAFYWGIHDRPPEKHVDAVHAKGLAGLVASTAGKGPFFANINWSNPHPPYNCPHLHAKRFDRESLSLLPGVEDTEKPLHYRHIRDLYGGLEHVLSTELKRKILLAYHAQTSFIDDLVGMLVKSVKDAGLWDDTIIIFASDHGDYVGQYNLVEKWDTGFEECLVKVPLIMAGGGLPRGVAVPGLTEHVDVLPSLCELLGLTAPWGLSGLSFVNMIRDPAARNKAHVLCEGGHESRLLDIPIATESHNAEVACYQGKASVRNACPDSLRKAKMIRGERWKYVFRVADIEELYDLETDPWEMRNLAGDPSFSDIKASMKDALLRTLIETEESRPFDPKPIA